MPLAGTWLKEALFLGQLLTQLLRMSRKRWGWWP